MKLLFDTDAFCKLAVAELLEDASRIFGADLIDCGRLAALPHMLRKGSLRREYGPDASDDMIRITAELPVMDVPRDDYLERLTPIDEIDPGEAQLFALAAERELPIVTGDKRALRALKGIRGFADALAKRIVSIEAILIALCNHLGPDVVRKRVSPIMMHDRVVNICFSSGNSDPHLALLSYQNSLAVEVSPLVLWNPPGGGDEE